MANKLKSNQGKYLCGNDKKTKKQSTEVFINRLFEEWYKITGFAVFALIFKDSFSK